MMNQNQCVTIAVALILLLGATVMPPWRHVVERQDGFWAKPGPYAFLFAPSIPDIQFTGAHPRIDWPRLALEYFAVFILAGIALAIDEASRQAAGNKRP